MTERVTAMANEPAQYRLSVIVVAISALIYLVGVPLIKYAPVLVHDGDHVPLLYLWDDTFYYFIIARNIIQGLGPTFDGIGLTNGFHILQTVLWMPVAAAVRDTDKIILFAYAQNVVMWAVSLGLIVAIARRLRLSLYVLLGLPFFVQYAAFPQIEMYFRGFETPYVVAAILAFVYYAIVADPFRLDAPARRVLLGGLLLALVFVARLDTVLWMGCLGLILLYRLVATLDRGALRARLPAGIRYFALLFGPTALLAVAYMLGSLAIFGTAFPVSAQAKSLGGPYFNMDILKYFIQLGGTRSVPFFSASIVVLVALMAIRLLAVQARDDRDPAAPRPSGVDDPSVSATMAMLLAAFLGGLLLEAALLFVMYYWEGESQYFYLLPVIAVLAVPIVARALLRDLKVSALGVSALCLMGALIMSGLLGIHFLRFPTEEERRDNNYLEHSRYVAEWLKENTPADSLYAMGDRAGSLALFLDRPVYQLQGLVNSKEFLEARRAGIVDNDYLLSLGIDYVAASGYGRSQPKRDAGPGCIWVMEPFWGKTAPKVELRLCNADRLYHEILDTEQCYAVWRLRGTYADREQAGPVEAAGARREATSATDPCDPRARR